MSLSTTSHSASDADSVGPTAGQIKAWFYTEVISQDTDSTTIKYVFGLDQSSSYNDNQDFLAVINGSTQDNETVLNNKGSGSFKFFEINKVYGRPLYGSAAAVQTARAQVSGIYNGPTSDTGTHNIDTTVPARAGQYLGAPGGFGVNYVDSSQIGWYWSAPASSGIGPAPTSYNMQVAYDPGFTSLVFNANVGNVLSRVISGLSRATSYYARIQAVNSVGGGTWTGAVGYTTSATVPDTMSAPTLSDVTTTGFTVGFVGPNNGGSGITSYEIQVSTDNFATVAATYTGIPSSPKVITGLLPGVKYKARVRAINGVGGASWSSASAEIQSLGGVKIWTGSAWGDGLVRTWNGSAWVVVIVRKWNGSSWVV